MTDPILAPAAADPAGDPLVDPAAMNNRRKYLRLFAIVLAGIAVIWGVWYFLTQSGRVHTDNAYVGADTAVVTPLVSGAVKDVRVGGTQLVVRGDVLVVIDDADARIELANAEALLVQARQRFRQARAGGASSAARVDARGAEVAQAQARLTAAQADFSKAQDAFNRRQQLAASGAVSAEEVSQSRAAMLAARAALAQAQASIATAAAMRSSAVGDRESAAALTTGFTEATAPDIAAAQARVELARLNLDRTVIRAPISGVVTSRNVQIGQRINAGAPLMVLVPLDAMFVDANFKESQLRGVKPGQPVELTSDFHGSSVVYTGTVQGFAGGTGAAFALIPAQNATGNWVKVVQRLPVRIQLDPAQLKAHPLRVGLSMSATIDTREQ
ncbi:HlyD family efflux transporter periplasmic adaptor subunit [Novosphingobium sp.]|uniref:HlyD family secretion protein n=1 Tax=Novosphingobium sp. TaxID=1874826 RepID=UPI0027360A37|nr:HlyD family efflux transporter periplasmic adaptor subunit [Novosphingobium sp.]MDP3907326.1 HlyD family efflux transporter periplasmic adaptor subunit [Novosphingobium sp.]